MPPDIRDAGVSAATRDAARRAARAVCLRRYSDPSSSRRLRDNREPEGAPNTGPRAHDSVEDVVVGDECTIAAELLGCSHSLGTEVHTNHLGPGPGSGTGNSRNSTRRWPPMMTAPCMMPMLTKSFRRQHVCR